MLLLPSTLPAFAIKWGQFVHQNITFNGLNSTGPVPILGITAPKFELTLDNGVNTTFSITSIDEITDHNVSTDDLQGGVHTRLHFDSEDLAGGSDRLIRLRENLVLNLVDPVFFEFTSPESAIERQVRVTNSRAILGRALHTLQDFYAHTNWVERHTLTPTEINSHLGNAIVPSPPEGTECNSSALQATPLTSGWFLNDLGDAYCGAPENKCAHGSEFCGIHKDFITRPGFATAQAMAIKATNTYTRETLQAVLAAYTRLVPELGTVGAKQAVRLAVCEFMGVADPLATCITSHTITVQKLNKNTGQPTLEGLVQSSGGNITPALDCGLLCEGTSIAGTSVTLTAKDHAGWKFARWASGGACAGSTSPDCSFTITGNQLAKPEFTFLDFVSGLSPQSSFLRRDPGDATLDPLVIDLSELEIEPGEILELSAFGWFAWGPGLPEDARSTIMVFSSSNELLSHSELHRVPGALPALVSGVVTTDTCSSPAPLTTDIPEDFQVFGTRAVTVPAGALFLFVGTFDCAYSDNSDSNGDLGIAIRYPLD